jgi:hypothetical protein
MIIARKEILIEGPSGITENAKLLIAGVLLAKAPGVQSAEEEVEEFFPINLPQDKEVKELLDKLHSES